MVAFKTKSTDEVYDTLLNAYIEYRKLGFFSWYFRSAEEYGRAIALKSALYQAEVTLHKHCKNLPSITIPVVQELANLCSDVREYAEKCLQTW